MAEFPFFAYNSLDNVLEISHGETSQLIDIFEHISYEQANQAPNYKRVAQAYTMALLYKVKSIWEQRRAVINHINSSYSEAAIVALFDNLVSEHVGTPLRVSYYAEKLHISPKHLSYILKKNTGKTAKQLIDLALALEAKILLKSEGLTISEIAYSLGFEDTSNFTKFFKRMTGSSPTGFRNHP